MQDFTQGANGRQGRIVVCPIKDLRPHPSYSRLQLRVSSAQISALAASSSEMEPLVITHECVVIDGYARLELARQRGLSSLVCIAYKFSETEALVRILETHRRPSSFNAFVRIALALDLEPLFQDRATANQRHGGVQKASSNLTEADKVDVRDEIARAAGVSSGNVTKVKQVLAAGHGELLAALRSGEIRIHRAWRWSKNPREVQLDVLSQFRNERGIKKTIRTLISKHKPAKNSEAYDAAHLASALSKLAAAEPGSFTVRVLKGAGRTLFISEQLLNALRSQEEAPPK
jgi:hypothetical protein